MNESDLITCKPQFLVFNIRLQKVMLHIDNINKSDCLKHVNVNTLSIAIGYKKSCSIVKGGGEAVVTYQKLRTF